MVGDPRHPWQTSETDELFTAIRSLKTQDEAARFFRDLCTLSELEAMAHRWRVAQLVDQGLPYHEVARRTGASTATVTRVAHWLRHGEGGYRLALDRLPARRRKREPAPTV
jgi:TrpR-related protein YerC/YecD